jgi:2-phospho-L-lactate guanylyltransferase
LLARSAFIERTLVISSDDSVLQMARELGAFTVNEPSASDLNVALQKATEVAVLYGATSLLVLPSDLPLLGEDDVKTLTDVNGCDRTVVVAPDRHGTGTNALFVRPPGAQAGGEGMYLPAARRRV